MLKVSFQHFLPFSLPNPDDESNFISTCSTPWPSGFLTAFFRKIDWQMDLLKPGIRGRRHGGKSDLKSAAFESKLEFRIYY
jgi:hypothetical protein